MIISRYHDNCSANTSSLLRLLTEGTSCPCQSQQGASTWSPRQIAHVPYLASRILEETGLFHVCVSINGHRVS